MNYHLVTHGKIYDEESKKKLLFIDKYLANKYEKKINFSVNQQEILDFKQREILYRDVYNLSEKFIKKIGENLNLIHNTNFDERSWKIIIGPWLTHFLRICHNRYFKIYEAKKNYNITETCFFYSDNFSFIPNNTNDLITMCNDDDWNAILYSQIINFLLPNIDFKKKILNVDIKIKKNNFNLNIRKVFSKIISLFIKRKDALIMGSYLPFFENIKLNLYLKQFPQYWIYDDNIYANYNLKLRENFKLNFISNDFEKFISKIIPMYLPICFMEGFKTLLKKVDEVNFPNKPKFIFTSNNYEYDEIFKLFTASKVQNNSTYIIAQHGNISWIENSFFKESYSADYYLHWGKDGFGKNQDGFNLKIVNNSLQNKMDGGVLILDSSYGTNNKIYNRLDENLNKEEWLFDILKSLKPEIKEITVKLHSSFKQRDTDYIKRIQSISSKINIEKNNSKLFELLKACRCVIHCYDSTGILETMSLKIPTLCIWPNGLNHIQLKYHDLYRDLEKNSILFSEPYKLTETLNNNFEKINEWWLEPNRTKIRNKFLDSFSIPPKNNSTKVLSRKLLDYGQI